MFSTTSTTSHVKSEPLPKEKQAAESSESSLPENQPRAPDAAPPPLPESEPLPGFVDFAAAISCAQRLGPFSAPSFSSVIKPIPVTSKKDSDLGIGHPSSAFTSKRRESHEDSDERSSKIQCNHAGAGGGFDTLDNTIQDVTNAIDRERRKNKEEVQRVIAKHQEELRMKDVQCAEEVQKVKETMGEEIRKLQASLADEAKNATVVMKHIEDLKKAHADEIDRRNLAMAKEIKQQKVACEAAYKQKLEDQMVISDRIKHNLDLEISKLKAVLETTERFRREDFRKIEQQLDDRESRHRLAAMTELSKNYEKQVQMIRQQYDSECRAKLAEQKTVYETDIAALKTEIVMLRKDLDSHKKMEKLVDLFETLLQNLYTASSQLAAIKTHSGEISDKTREIIEQANQFRGFMAAWQRPPVMFYPPPLGQQAPPQPHPPQPHLPGPGPRVRHGAFSADVPHAQP